MSAKYNAENQSFAVILFLDKYARFADCSGI